MQLHEALTQISEIRSQIARSETFRGYRSVTTAFTAVLAVLTSAVQARWVTEYHPVETATEEPDGGLTVTLRVGDPAWLARLLLRLGGTATLVDPPALGEQVRATALRALQHYS